MNYYMNTRNITHPVDFGGHVDELGVVTVELGLLDLDDHLIVLIVRLGASIFIIDVLSATTVIEDGDLKCNRVSKHLGHHHRKISIIQ